MPELNMMSTSILRCAMPAAVDGYLATRFAISNRTDIGIKPKILALNRAKISHIIVKMTLIVKNQCRRNPRRSRLRLCEPPAPAPEHPRERGFGVTSAAHPAPQSRIAQAFLARVRKAAIIAPFRIRTTAGCNGGMRLSKPRNSGYFWEMYTYKKELGTSGTLFT